jgi:hypothetical protein
MNGASIECASPTIPFFVIILTVCPLELGLECTVAQCSQASTSARVHVELGDPGTDLATLQLSPLSSAPIPCK